HEVGQCSAGNLAIKTERTVALKVPVAGLPQLKPTATNCNLVSSAKHREIFINLVVIGREQTRRTIGADNSERARHRKVQVIRYARRYLGSKFCKRGNSRWRIAPHS